VTFGVSGNEILNLDFVFVQAEVFEQFLSGHKIWLRKAYMGDFISKRPSSKNLRIGCSMFDKPVDLPRTNQNIWLVFKPEGDLPYDSVHARRK